MPPYGPASEQTLQAILAALGGGGGMPVNATIVAPLGQAAMAASLPVAIANDQSAVPVSAAALPLPTGAATEVTLGALNGKVVACDTSALATEATLAAINGKITSCDTSALATEATLSALNGKVTACDTSALATQATLVTLATEATLAALSAKFGTLGQKNMAGSAPVVLASDQSALPISGSVSVTGALPLPTGAATEATLAQVATELTLQNIGTGVAKDSTLTALNSKVNTLGQKLMTGSTPVVLASDQSAVPVSVASLPLPTGAATEATLSALNGKVTACNTGAVVVTTLPSIPAGTNNIGDVDVVSSVLPTGAATEATLSSLNGKVTACNTGAVVVSTLPSIPAGPNDIGTVHAIGDVQHDQADVSGYPVKIGHHAYSTNRAAVTDGDRVNSVADRKGRQIVTLNQPRELTNHNDTTISNTSETTIVAAGGVGVFNDLLMLVMTNSGSVGTRVDIRDDTGTAVDMSVWLAPGGGAVIPFHTPYAQGASNDNWTAQLSATPTGGSVYIFAQYAINT